MAILRESGEQVKDIAQIFGVAPDTVTRAIQKVPEEELQAIRKLKSAELMSLHHHSARKALIALLQRDLNEKDDSGRYKVGESTLQRIAALASEKYVDLAALAGMGASPSDKAPMNSVMEFLQTSAKIAEATRGLPKNVRMRVHQELEVSEEPAGTGSGSPVDAPWEDDSSSRSDT